MTTRAFAQVIKVSLPQAGQILVPQRANEGWGRQPKPAFANLFITRKPLDLFYRCKIQIIRIYIKTFLLERGGNFHRQPLN